MLVLKKITLKVVLSMKRTGFIKFWRVLPSFITRRFRRGENGRVRRRRVLIPRLTSPRIFRLSVWLKFWR